MRQTRHSNGHVGAMGALCFLVLSLAVTTLFPCLGYAGPRESACRVDLGADKLVYWNVDGLMSVVSDRGSTDISALLSAVVDSRSALGEVPLTLGGDVTLTVTGDFVSFDMILRPLEFRAASDVLRISPFEFQIYTDSLDDESEGYSTVATYGRSLLGARWRLHDMSDIESATSSTIAFMDLYGGVRYGLSMDTDYPEASQWCIDETTGDEYYCPKGGGEGGVVPYFRLRADVTNAATYAYSGYILFSQYSGSGNEENLSYVMTGHKVAFSIASAFALEVGASGWTYFGEQDGGFMLQAGIAGSSVFLPCSE